jgi:hypothetical protein
MATVGGKLEQGRAYRAATQKSRRPRAIRQMVETLYDKLHHACRLDRERPHDLRGFQARLAVKLALHNFCMWLDGQLGQPWLAFADLIEW